MIVSRLSGATGTVRRKLVWLANYHNRFIAQLRVGYDESDPQGSFEATIGTAPRELFDALVIDLADDVSQLLAEIANR